jgi:hypothetical protein
MSFNTRGMSLLVEALSAIFSSFQPIIFESMYFIEHDPVTHKGELMGTNWEYTSEREGFLLARYSTEEQALAGHDQLIEACKDGSWKEL